MSDRNIEQQQKNFRQELRGLIEDPSHVEGLSEEVKAFLRDNDCFKDDSETELKYELVEANGLVCLVDPLRPELGEGEMPVYSFHDEAAELLRISKSLGEKFDTVVDAFSGGGHSMLPILDNGIANKGKGVDVNPRAVQLAGINSAVNELEGRANFTRGDTKAALPDKNGRTLFIANPPFALAVKGVQLEKMRDGGENGLVLTEAYLDRSLEAAEDGDWIVGVAYSRISRDGSIELEDLIKDKIGENCKYEVKLIEGATLWREPDGIKRQPNPMPISEMHTKARPEDTEAVESYNQASKFHIEQGWDKLGYFEYRIYVGGTEIERQKTKESVESVLRKEM